MEDSYRYELFERELNNLRSKLERNEDKINELVVVTSIADTKYQNIISSLAELKIKIESIALKPQKRWEMLVMSIASILCTVVSAIIIYKITKM